MLKRKGEECAAANKRLRAQEAMAAAASARRPISAGFGGATPRPVTSGGGGGGGGGGPSRPMSAGGAGSVTPRPIGSGIGGAGGPSKGTGLMVPRAANVGTVASQVTLRLEASTASPATLACAAMPPLPRPLLTHGASPTAAGVGIIE